MIQCYNSEVAISEALPKLASDSGSPLVLHQFTPAWEVQAYARFARLKLHVENSRYPEFATTGQLPQLRDGNFLIGRHEIVTHLQTVRELWCLFQGHSKH